MEWSTRIKVDDCWTQREMKGDEADHRAQQKNDEQHLGDGHTTEASQFRVRVKVIRA